MPEISTSRLIALAIIWIGSAGTVYSSSFGLEGNHLAGAVLIATVAAYFLSKWVITGESN